MAFIKKTHHEVSTTVPYYVSGLLDGVIHGFSTRIGGVSQPPRDTMNLGSSAHDRLSDVLENYARFTRALGVAPDSPVFTKQVHGDAIRTAGPEHRGNGLTHPSVWECDALVTDCTGLTLTIFWADCVPILLYDPVRCAVGAAHAGWRGTVLGIASKTAALMVERYGSRPADLRAAIGPCIGHCCFETRSDVPEALASAHGKYEMSPFITDHMDGRFHVNLAGINARLLERFGVSDIDVSGICTCCNGDEFFSHRRTGTQRGTHAAMISLSERTDDNRQAIR